MTLRTRLAWTYGIAVAIAVLVVALTSVTAIDRALRSTLDARLETAAGAVTALVDVKHGRLSLDSEDRTQMAAALTGSMDAVVVNRSGSVYEATKMPVPDGVMLAIESARGAESLFAAGSGDTAIRIAVAPVARDRLIYGEAAVWQSSAFIDEFDRYAIIAMAVAALLGGGVVVVLSSTLARRALAPLERVSVLATEIEAHDLSRRLGASGADELGRLGAAFDRMLDRLEAAFARQRRFTADASHELRAPLAVIRTEADVALARERPSEEYRRALSTIASEVDRIDALVDAMLSAARADSAALVREPFDLAALCALAIERFRPAASARGVKISFSGESVTVVGDERAIERALAGILHNAIEFAATRIDVSLCARDGSGEVAIGDDGPGFSSEALMHATERFWREDPARARGGGAGLGLSIAQSIVNAHGGRLGLSNGPENGARVTIAIPRSS